MTRVALVDDTDQERQLDAQFLEKSGYYVTQMRPDPDGPEAVAAHILAATVDAVAVDWQLNLTPGVTYNGVAILEVLRAQAPRLPAVLWAKQRKLMDDVLADVGSRFPLVAKEDGTRELANVIDRLVNDAAEDSGSFTVIAEVLTIDEEDGSIEARLFGLGQEPVRLKIPEEGLPVWASETGTLARLRVVTNGIDFRLVSVDELEPQRSFEELTQELESLGPKDGRITAG